MGVCRCRLAKIKAWVDENDPRGILIPWSAALEQQLVDLSPEECETLLKEKETSRLTPTLSCVPGPRYVFLHVCRSACHNRFFDQPFHERNWIK